MTLTDTAPDAAANRLQHFASRRTAALLGMAVASFSIIEVFSPEFALPGRLDEASLQVKPLR
jgi:hypothetical protein